MPITIKFEAIFQPNQRKFCVSVKIGDKRRIVERMTISKFIRFARETDKKLVIDGQTIEMVEDKNGDAMKGIRDYFKKVANTYAAAHWGKGGKPENN